MVAVALAAATTVTATASWRTRPRGRRRPEAMLLPRCNTWPPPLGLGLGQGGCRDGGTGPCAGPCDGTCSATKIPSRPHSSEEDSGTNEEEVLHVLDALAPGDADLIRQQVSQIQQLHEQSNQYLHHRNRLHRHRGYYYYNSNNHRPHRGCADATLAEDKTIRTQIPLQTTAAAVLPVLVLANGDDDGAVGRAADLVSGAASVAASMAAAGRRHRRGSPVLALDTRKKVTLGRHYYPEGGWGWVVVTCSVVVHLLGHGLQLSWPVMQQAASSKFTVHISHTGTWTSRVAHASPPKQHERA